jgi:hypothetical protein
MTRQIYPRIADNYRGRIRGLDVWDAYFHYTCRKGTDVSKKAPYYHEAFCKRVVNSDFDWIFIPKEVRGEGARVPQTIQEPDVVEIEQRSTPLDENAVVSEENGVSFVRVKPSPSGTRLAVLSCDTDRKTRWLRIRTTGVAGIEMSGLKKPWLLPDTQGQWRRVAYTMNDLERWGDIVFFLIKGSPETQVDLDHLVRKPDEKLIAPGFSANQDDMRLIAYVAHRSNSIYQRRETESASPASTCRKTLR